MTRVNIEETVDHLSTELRAALRETLKKHFPNQSFDEREVFRTFKKMVGRKCSTWEFVPDAFVNVT